MQKITKQIKGIKVARDSEIRDFLIYEMKILLMYTKYKTVTLGAGEMA